MSDDVEGDTGDAEGHTADRRHLVGEYFRLERSRPRPVSTPLPSSVDVFRWTRTSGDPAAVCGPAAC
jgi:hypothetical protein